MEWLPTSGYEYGNGPDFELYYDGDVRAEDCRSKVWLHIVKAAQEG